MAVDPYSLTWKAVESFITEQRNEAVEMLIADRESERQRGALVVLERLQALASQEEPPPTE
jgi:hypothetical protein